MDAGALDRLVAELRDGDTLFLVHRNADPDAVGSALALARAFGGVVGAPGGVSAAGRRVLAHLGAEVEPLVHPHRHARVAAVDTSSRVQLGPAARRVDPAALLLVDHHAEGDLMAEARIAAVDASRASCAEVVLTILDHAGVAPDGAAAFALAAGVVADTARFRYGGHASLRAFLRLAEPHGFTVADVARVLEEAAGDDVPRRIAHLRAAERARYETRGDVLVVESRVGAYEASAARALVRLGADLAVVAAEKGGEGRVSLRASDALLARGVDLAAVADAVARENGWSAGGHAGAAGLNGPPPTDAVARALVDAVTARLAARAGEV